MPTKTTYLFPSELYYDRASHLWVCYDAGVATIGLDALGLESLGDLAYLSLNEVGRMLWRGQPAGTLEAAKMVGDLIAPVSGTLIALNADVLRDPGLVNRDPYGAGWLMQIAPSDWAAEAGHLVHGVSVTGWSLTEVERYRLQGWVA